MKVLSCVALRRQIYFESVEREPRKLAFRIDFPCRVQTEFLLRPSFFLRTYAETASRVGTSRTPFAFPDSFLEPILKPK